VIHPVLEDVTYAPFRLEGTAILTGVVASHQPGTNLIDVRIGNARRVVRKVRITYGAEYQPGDVVVIVRTPVEQGWIAVARVQNNDEYGLNAALVQAANQLHPPSSFTVDTVGGLIIAEWEGWAGASVCFQIQHNSSTTELYADEFFTRGSYFLYETTAVETRFFRIRSVRYDVVNNESYYSAWTDWQSATSSLSQEDTHNLLLVHMHDMDEMWTMHLLGEL